MFPFSSLKLSGDIISATITFSKPRLDLPKVPSSITETYMSPVPTAYPSFPELDTASVGFEVYTLVKSISQQAFRFVEHPHSLTSSIPIIIFYTQILSAIEHRLLSIDIPFSLASPPELPSLHVLEISRIAALISTTYYFRNLTINSAAISSLRKHLVATISTLESTQHDFLDRDSLKLLLWACWIGGLTAKDQEWFAIRIHRYMTWLELPSWEELESSLQGFILTPRRHDLHGSSLWLRVSKIFMDFPVSSLE
jgi:hypothetical protein